MHKIYYKDFKLISSSKSDELFDDIAQFCNVKILI